MPRTATKRAGPQAMLPAKRVVSAKPRARRQSERREAILAAALEEFSASGFAAARLDDVARRAGVAKEIGRAHV